jgi:hypothetical protein
VNGFNNIQNIVGGNNGNTFIFANSASISGSLNGGTLSSTQVYFNTLDLSAYSSLVTVNLVGGIFGGNAANSSAIATYSNIDKLVGNYAFDNRITLPSGKTTNVVLTGYKEGYIGDPTYFFGFVMSATPTPPAPTPTVPAMSNDSVASIVQQPTTNATSNSPTTAEPQWIMNGSTLNTNINDMVKDASKAYDEDIDKLKINPYCTSASN